MTYEENLAEANRQGLPEACCLICEGRHARKACENCDEQTQAFSFAVMEFMKAVQIPKGH